MRERPIVIAGAGLAGLSTAYHLGDTPYRLVEREREVGGLCRSIRQDGFTFDYTGHLLHLRRPEMKELVAHLLPSEAWMRIHRRSGIYSHGVFTEYPFQVNTYGLPLPVVRECVMGYAEALQRPADLGSDPSFRRWALATFGEGIARHFLFPYNQKLFLTDLEAMSAEWVSWSIPRPSWADVVRGALGTNRRVFGYNPQFLYPVEAGIDHLPRAFLRHLREPETGVSVERVVARQRIAELSTGETVGYRALVSSLPLDALVERTVDAPESLKEGARRLRAVSVLNLNLAYDAPCPSPYQWVYFPEARFPFYRVGVYTNLAPASAPPGTSSFYVEISYAGVLPDAAELIERCDEALRETGLVPAAARRRIALPVPIPVAYVVYDAARRTAVAEAEAFFRANAIHPIGRYGRWEYGAMEDALWQGREVAGIVVRGR